MSDVHFMFNNIIYKHADKVVMGSPLGPVLASTFIVELVQKLFLTFFLNDFILSVLNSFYPQIQFTYEKEIDLKVNILDVLLISNGSKLSTKVYMKLSNTNIFIYWNSFATIQWKRSTLNMLISRVYIVSFNTYHLNAELKYIRQIFNKVNGCPHWFLKKATLDCQRKN